jgi:hypothetical protein
MAAVGDGGKVDDEPEPRPGSHPGHSKPRINPGLLPNLMRSAFPLALPGVLDQNRLQSAALFALSKGEGLSRDRCERALTFPIAGLQ